MNKITLYKNIMKTISRTIKRQLNEAFDYPSTAVNADFDEDSIPKKSTYLNLKGAERSKKRLNDILNGPNRDRWDYYENLLNRCSEDKRRERVQTWYDILLTENPRIAKKIETVFRDYLSSSQLQSIVDRENELRRAEEEKRRQQEIQRVAQEKIDKEKNIAFDIICKYLLNNDKLRLIAYRSPVWNSYGGRIGSYSHNWYKPGKDGDNKKIKDINSYLRKLSNTLLKQTTWRGGYDYDFGILYNGGASWDTVSYYDNLQGSYDDDCSIKIYTIRSRSNNIKMLLTSEIEEKCPNLSLDDITEIINNIIN